jgi:hypothetical protein
LEVLKPPPPFLIGAEPFPGLNGWTADAALFIRQNLGARCGVDPEGGAVLRSIDSLDQQEWVSTLLRPEFTAFLMGEPSPWTWRKLTLALERPSDPATNPGIIEHPSLEMLAILKKSGKGSRRESCENAAFLPPGSEAFEKYRDKIQRAIAVIGTIAPGFAIEMQSVVDCIAIVDNQASFRGASGLMLRGMVMLSPDETWTTGVFAEELVHETTHTLLDLISIRQPLLEGDDALTEQWSAPFRPDKRPLIGNFHALVVICRLVHLFGKFRGSIVNAELNWVGRASDYVSRSRQVLQSIEEYPRLSPMAHSLLKHLIKPTIALLPEQFELLYPAASPEAHLELAT